MNLESIHIYQNIIHTYLRFDRNQIDFMCILLMCFNLFYCFCCSVQFSSVPFCIFIVNAVLLLCFVYSQCFRSIYFSVCVSCTTRSCSLYLFDVCIKYALCHMADMTINNAYVSFDRTRTWCAREWEFINKKNYNYLYIIIVLRSRWMSQRAQLIQLVSLKPTNCVQWVVNRTKWRKSLTMATNTPNQTPQFLFNK